MRSRILRVEIRASDKYCDNSEEQCSFVRRAKPDWSYKCVLFRGADGKGCPLHEEGENGEWGRLAACIAAEEEGGGPVRCFGDPMAEGKSSFPRHFTFLPAEPKF